MIKLNKIITKTGDKGFSKFKKKKISKNSFIFEVFGDLDELNAFLGLGVSSDKKHVNIKKFINLTQHKLFNIGAEILTINNLAKFEYKININDIKFLEEQHNFFNKDLSELNSFLIPGGSLKSNYFNVARTTCRKAERKIVFLAKTKIKTDKYKFILIYINRLSDVLFTLSRYINYKNNFKEEVWIKDFNIN